MPISPNTSVGASSGSQSPSVPERTTLPRAPPCGAARPAGGGCAPGSCAFAGSDVLIQASSSSWLMSSKLGPPSAVGSPSIGGGWPSSATMSIFARACGTPAMSPSRPMRL